MSTTATLCERPDRPASRKARDPRVLLAGGLTVLDSPGGGEIQMASTARALRGLGIDASLWRPWEETLGSADCLHLFGSRPEHLPLVEAARRQGVPVVLSTIAWFDPAAYWAEPRGLIRRLAACAALAARAGCPRMPSWRRKLYESVDLLAPNSHAEAAQLVRYFGVSPGRIHVVPNGADPRFAKADPEPFERLAGVRGFVLSAGRIEPRKNQLGLLRAMRGTGVPVVLLGDAVPGHESYEAQCRRAAGDEVRFIGRVDHDDRLLDSAYAACGCVVLAGWYETPGLVALEAGMSGVPLVLPARGAAREYFADRARYVKPRDLPAIREAVLAALAERRSPGLAGHVCGNFSWEAAARATRDAYQKVL